MPSSAAGVKEYLAKLPAERRAALEAVRAHILENLDAEFEEGMQYGMIGYYVPHRVFPAGYHVNPKEPLPFLALASQKQSMALYLMHLYADPAEAERFKAAWAKAGKKLDMGKSCLRFRKLDDLALDVLGAALRRVSAKAYVAQYQRQRDTHRERSAGARSGPAASERRTPKAPAKSSKASARKVPSPRKKAKSRKRA